MQHSGTLRNWHDDRGFGFIAPAGGGRELFVHISAFPQDGTRPTVGETLSYELGRGKDGKPAAIRVIRQAWGEPADRPLRLKPLPVRDPAFERLASRPHGRERGSSAARVVLFLVKLCVIGGALVWGYTELQGRYERRQLANQPALALSTPVDNAETASFRCDGRTHCSQMTSCREAKFFIKNCPGTQMDGNNDGIPCQQQWCTSLFAD